MAPMQSLYGLLNFGPAQAAGLLTVCLGVGFLLYRVVYNLCISPLRHIPGPKLAAISEIYWTLMQISGQNHKRLTQLHLQYGDVVRLAPDRVSIVSPTVWKEVSGHRKAGQPENEKDILLYKQSVAGIIGADTVAHGRQRRILAHGFSAQSMRDQEPLIRGYIDLLIQQLYAYGRRGGAPLDMTAWYNWTTFDMIGDLTFGEPFGCLREANYHPWVALVCANFKDLAVMSQFRAMFPHVEDIFSKLVQKYVMPGRTEHLNLTRNKVDKRIELGTDRPDFMSALLRKDDVGDDKLSMASIYKNADTLLAAGSETTATTLSNATYLLCKHPDVLAKLAEEVRTTFSCEEDINLLSVSKLKYMLAVLDETLRLLPAVPGQLPRRIHAGGQVIGGYYLPAGTAVAMAMYAMYHQPSHFVLPEEFHPERWLGDPRFANDEKELVQPFSYGPRSCLGKNLAYAEMRLVLARVIWNFNPKLAADSEDYMDRLEAYAVYKKPPLNVYLVPRNTSEKGGIP